MSKILIGESGSKDQAFGEQGLAKQSTAEKGTSTWYGDGGGGSRCGYDKSRCRCGEDRAQKAEKGDEKNEFSFHFSEIGFGGF